MGDTVGRIIFNTADKITVTLPNDEFQDDFLEINALESVIIDYRQLRKKIKEAAEREVKLVEALKERIIKLADCQCGGGSPAASEYKDKAFKELGITE